MQTAEERLSWAIRFSQEDLTQLTEAARIHLRIGLRDFLGESKTKEQEWSLEIIARAKAAIRSMLFMLVDGNEMHPPMKDMHGESTSIIETQQIWYTVTSEREFRVSVRADLVTAVVFTMVEVFRDMRHELRKIRKCQSCSTILFARHGRQLFCSSTCKTREHSKRLRERDREEFNARHRRLRQRRKKTLAPPQKKNRLTVHA